MTGPDAPKPAFVELTPQEREAHHVIPDGDVEEPGFYLIHRRPAPKRVKRAAPAARRRKAA